jgi:hypothetical protein
MTIRVVSARKRSKVIWLGEPPSNKEKKSLVEKGFELDSSGNISILGSDSILSSTAGVIFAQSNEQPLRIVEMLSDHASRLLDFDCLVFVLSTETGIAAISSALSHLKLPAVWPTQEQPQVFDGETTRPQSEVGEPEVPYISVYRAGTSIERVAEYLLGYASDRPPISEGVGGITIRGPASATLTGTDRILLRRAFADCTDLFIEGSSGDSGVKVVLAHATLKDASMARPLPFFVKIGDRRKIVTEWIIYNTKVHQYVPFHLAPRLVADRCGLGARNGIIVGDFVEDSESLGDCARSGRAATNIGTLFDRTLRGWHRQARIERRKLASVLSKWLEGKLDDERVALAREQGATTGMDEMRAVLNAREKEPMQWGPIHGDLHAKNVRTRGTDSILIDFFSYSEGPLLADAAALEASLLIRAPADRNFDATEWRAAIEPLISRDAFQSPPTTLDTTGPYQWLGGAIRQIRLHAYALEKRPGQYAVVLACALLRLACKDPNCSGEEKIRRAYAYCLAERILKLAWA